MENFLSCHRHLDASETSITTKKLLFNTNASNVTVGAMCCVGAALFLIASTIVLSLIPIYLPVHGFTLNYIQDQTQLFYIEYSTTVDNETVNYSVFVSNLANPTRQLNEQLGLSTNTIVIENIVLVQQNNYAHHSRKKRALDSKMLLTCRANYPRLCRSTACRQQFLADIHQRCSNHSHLVLQLQSASVTDQTIQFDSQFLDFTFAVPADFLVPNQISSATTTTTTTTTSQTPTNTCCNATNPTPTNIQLVQTCLGQNPNKHPVIIDTDTDVDDIWAILYLLNVPTVDILAITTVGDGFSSPFYSTSNVLSFLGLVGCTDRLAVSSGLSTPSLSSGYIITDSILAGADTYFTASTCLNQSTNIFLQPSPFEAVELMVYTLKYSSQPVDILALGPLTNIAAAIIRDRSIVPKIGTIYISGGQFKALANSPPLMPNPNLGIYPYTKKTSGTSSNVFLDVLAVQRVDDSGIKNLVAIPSTVQKQLPANLTQIGTKLKELNITLTPFIYALITSFAKCTNVSESSISWWDNSAAQLMVQLQNNITNGFCTTLQNVQSLYILSADADQLYGEGLINFQQARPNTNGLSNYTICTQTNLDTFLTEFLTKISAKEYSACEQTYQNRFDIKLQSCLNKYGLD